MTKISDSRNEVGIYENLKPAHCSHLVPQLGVWPPRQQRYWVRQGSVYCEPTCSRLSTLFRDPQELLDRGYSFRGFQDDEDR